MRKRKPGSDRPDSTQRNKSPKNADNTNRASSTKNRESHPFTDSPRTRKHVEAMREREKAHLASNINAAQQKPLQHPQQQTQQQTQQHSSFFQPEHITEKITELKAYINRQGPNIVTTAATAGAVALIIAALPVSTEKKWGLSIASLIIGAIASQTMEALRELKATIPHL